MSRNVNDTNIEGRHIPILLKESLDLLKIKSSEFVVDCTTNRAGHASEFAKLLNHEGRLICIDLDSVALSEAKQKILQINSNLKVDFVNSNFANLNQILSDLNLEKVDVIYADLGVSSQEIDISGRGFSFMRDEPLLMTFKDVQDLTEDDLTAKEIVNEWSEETIADIIYAYGDEKFSRRIAKGIVEARVNKKIETTFDLIEIIKRSVPEFYTRGKSHFATRTFQALRITVNNEMESIKQMMEAANQRLNIGGRLGLITFHSTEDRIVKQKAKELQLTPINKKVITADKEETKINPRSRSAKLRVYTKK